MLGELALLCVAALLFQAEATDLFLQVFVSFWREYTVRGMVIRREGVISLVCLLSGWCQPRGRTNAVDIDSVGLAYCNLQQHVIALLYLVGWWLTLALHWDGRTDVGGCGVHFG